MRLTCPCCHVELSLDLLLTNEAARHAVARLATVSLPFGALTLRYMALFRPEKRGLSIERMVKLIEELLPDLERGFITRKGRDWSVDIETWRAGMETVLAKRDKGDLTLPLTSHGLLLEVMAGFVDRAERRAEGEREETRRARRNAGVIKGPRDLAEVAAVWDGVDSGPVPLLDEPQRTATPAAPPPDYTRPSKAALQLRAQIEAARLAKTGTTDQPQQEGHA
jgi:hypothetical protein